MTSPFCLTDDERHQQFYGGSIDTNRKLAGRILKEKAVQRGLAMNAGWKVFWLFAAVFAAALGLERTFVPNVVPIAFADKPQPLWMVESAFVLRALELMTGSVALIALLLMLGVWADRLRQVQGKVQAKLKARLKGIVSQIAR
jgi:hypothetical protein